METQDNFIMHEGAEALGSERKVCSKVALIMAAVVVVGVVVQVLLSFVLSGTGIIEDQTLAIIVLPFVSMYVFALPVGVLFLKRGATETGGHERFSIGKIICFILMGEGLMYIGNLAGTMLAILISGGSAANPVMTLATGEGYTLLKIVCLVLIAPLLEELVFRKLIIDNIKGIDEKTAVVFSAIAFGLYHMNLFQFFYTAAIGLLWGYVYLRTGKIRYSYIMHAFMNFKGMIVAGFVLSHSHLEEFTGLQAAEDAAALIEQNPDILAGMAVYLLYALFNFALAITGIVLLVRNRNKWLFAGSPSAEYAGRLNKKMLFNAGTAIFAVICVAIMGANLLWG